MTYVPPPGAIASAAADVLKGWDRAEGSGYDDNFIDLIAEDYEYFVTPDHKAVPRKDVDRNFDKMLTGAEGLLDALRRSRDDGLTEAFHEAPMNHPLDRYRLTMGELERWLERLLVAVERCREQPGVSGRRAADRPTQLAAKLAEHFYLLTRVEPTLTKKPGLDYCGGIARLFAVLHINDVKVETYARKIISMRKPGSTAPI